VPVYGYYAFQNPPYVASRQLLIARIVDAGTSFSPLPCLTWHGYIVTIAHRVEVKRCFPVVRRELQPPRPTVHPSVPSSLFFFSELPPSPPCLLIGSVYESIQSRKKYRTARAGDLGVRSILKVFLKALRTWLPDIR
jgi:hypothetical protein